MRKVAPPARPFVRRMAGGMAASGVMRQPELHSARLLLRPFVPDDARGVQRLAGDRAIADTTLNIPHPYEDGLAEEWIALHGALFEEGTSVIFAILLQEAARLIGAISFVLDRRVKSGELGYWIGKPYWGQGYATEAAARVLQYGFDTLQLNRVSARHLVRNPASGRVMQNIGMQYEGTLRQAVVKWDRYEDLNVYGLLRDEWQQLEAR